MARSELVQRDRSHQQRYGEDNVLEQQMGLEEFHIFTILRSYPVGNS
jgi:hypothetical protein